MSRVLIIEPDVILAKQYASALEKKKYDVIRAATAAKAIRLLDENSFDAVVMELQLGQHNGLELLYEIRSYEDLRTLPIVIHSSVDPEIFTDTAGYKLLHISACLYKPETKQTKLCQTVTEAIDSSQAFSK